ncbi:MAG: hypothetical protein ACFFCM_08690 [Promethearchaeota archaeon]
MKKKAKVGILSIIIILFLILIIFGWITLIYSDKVTNRDLLIRIMAFYEYGFSPNSLLIIYVLYLASKPFQIQGIGLMMILLGIFGQIVSIFYYIGSEYSYKFKKYYKSPKSKKLKSISISTRGPKRGITISKCPACKAPLKKTPPCECDYCGAILK